MSVLDETTLAELEDKYRQLVEMRAEREALQARGIMRFEGEALRERSRRGKALAQRFPGVLRELDTLSLGQLEQRLADVRAARAGGAPAPWIEPLWLLHGLTRVGLSVKRWLNGPGRAARDLDADGVTALRSFVERHGEGCVDPAAVDRALLEAYVSPPEGRLMRVVWRQLSERCDMTRGELEAMIYGEPHE